MILSEIEKNFRVVAAMAKPHQAAKGFLLRSKRKKLTGDYVTWTIGNSGHWVEPVRIK